MRSMRLPVVLVFASALSGCTVAPGRPLPSFPVAPESAKLDAAAIARLEKDVKIVLGNGMSRVLSYNHDLIGVSCQQWAGSDPPYLAEALNQMRYSAAKEGANEVVDVECATQFPNYANCWKSITCTGRAVVPAKPRN
jgi:uncharacterized protein YbjQ (UPF0145 family)